MCENAAELRLRHQAFFDFGHVPYKNKKKSGAFLAVWEHNVEPGRAP